MKLVKKKFFILAFGIRLWQYNSQYVTNFLFVFISQFCFISFVLVQSKTTVCEIPNTTISNVPESIFVHVCMRIARTIQVETLLNITTNIYRKMPCSFAIAVINWFFTICSIRSARSHMHTLPHRKAHEPLLRLL